MNYVYFENDSFGTGGGKVANSFLGMNGLGGLMHEVGTEVTKNGDKLILPKMKKNRNASREEKKLALRRKELEGSGEIGPDYTIRFFGIRQCEVRLNSLRDVLDGFFLNKVGDGAYGGFWDLEGDVNNVLDNDEIERRKKPYNGVRSLDISRNLFEITEFLKSRFKDKVVLVDTLGNFGPNMKFVRNRWDDSLYAAHYLPKMKYVNYSENLSKFESNLYRTHKG
jgi:hypothetical protein